MTCILTLQISVLRNKMVSLNTQLISLELFNTVSSYFYELVIGSADKATIFLDVKVFTFI